MQTIPIDQAHLYRDAKIITGGGEKATLLLPPEGGGFVLPEILRGGGRYLCFNVEAEEDHCVPMELIIHKKKQTAELKGDNIRFGIMPRWKVLICIDLQWLDGNYLFPGHTPGEMKVVRHGGRVTLDEVDHFSLETMPSYHELRLVFSDIRLADERPAEYPVPDEKLIDEFGQYKKAEWPGKTKDFADLKAKLEKAATLSDSFLRSDWSVWGGWKNKKLKNGTGFFSSFKDGKKWWLTDPEGYAFFSIGPCGTVVRSDCRVDGLEKLMDWLPAKNDPDYRDMYVENSRMMRDPACRTVATLFSFEQANLFKVFGKNWFDKWKDLVVRQLKVNNINTLANWSERRLFGKVAMPYVFMLDRFPQTELKIFRDFPDVLSDEYSADAKTCAAFLEPFKNDPYMVGYFLRNEPSWAFVENLVVADEVLYNPASSVSKEKLIAFLKDRYPSVDDLNKAWTTNFASFGDLEKPIRKASELSEKANSDLREFSRIMLDAYVSIPSKACREVDKNHLNLGMRWAWISDPDLVSGWKNFDVFSINCYSVNPTDAIENIVRLGVDLPVIIGEFHFGALDWGQPSTGLQGTPNQNERGKAYKYYVEKAASHPAGVGCHWFQFYDQFALGRFDGENYNIGLFDICSLANPVMMKYVKECGDEVYEVAAGKKEATGEKPEHIPMVAF